MLLVIILFVTLLSIAILVTLPSIGFELKRDREEELIHRGVQYTRAIQHYVKKFGRYPTTLEQLENTNQIRFLRHRYKDPITGKDFKLLHMEDVQTSFGPGIAGATPVSQMTPGAGQGPGGFGGGPFGNAGPGVGGLGNQGFGGPGFGSQGILQQVQAGIGGNVPQGGFGQTGFAGPGSQSPQAGGDDSGTAPGSPGGTNAPGGAGANTSGGFGSSSFGSSSGNQVFGGGPIVGVASTSKDKSIRVYNKKDHYNQWQFIYNPAMDRGGLLTGPGQPPTLQGGVSAGALASGQGNQGSGAQTPGQGFGGAFGGQPTQPNSPVTPPPMPPEQ